MPVQNPVQLAPVVRRIEPDEIPARPELPGGFNCLVIFIGKQHARQDSNLRPAD